MQIYYEDGDEMLQQLRTNLQRTDMKLFITHAHAMKSSSRNIGAVEVSELFKEMEFAGKDNDMDTIEAKLPKCLDTFEELQNNLKNYLENGEDSEEDSDEPDILFIKKMQSALEDMDTDTFDEMLEQVFSSQYNENIMEQFNKIQAAYDDFDFSRVNELLEEIME